MNDEPNWMADQARAAAADLANAPDYMSRFLTIDQVRKMPPSVPLIDGLLDLDSTALLYGARGSYKSFLALDLALSVAAGTRWQHRALTQATVVYVAAEGASGLSVRVAAWEREHPNSSVDDRLWFFPHAVNLLSPAAVGPFADACAALDARLVVLDTLARCMVGGDENAARDAGMFIEQADVIKNRTGACVLVVHHAGKDTTRGGRGSSAFEAAIDDVYALAADDADLTITCTKRKNHAEPSPIRLRAHTVADSIVLRTGRPADDLSAGVIETLRALDQIDTGNGASTTAWQLSVTTAEGTFYRHRKRLVTLDLVANVGTEKQPRYQVTLEGLSQLSPNSPPLT